MKQRGFPFWLAGSVILGYLATANPTQAQIASDGTTPSNVIQSGNVLEITGGTKAGNNLFHSFTEFSVPNSDVVRFVNNNAVIQNVINRVTGSSRSEIFGRIEAGGSAPNFNLFLLNPNGIIFGPNASLQISGAFVATTANAIQFNEQGFFSAAVPNDPSLLTVNPSAFLFNQIAARPITYQSNNQSVTGLQVQNNQSLLLLGGEVILDGGTLLAPNGRVELGGLAGVGVVGLNIDSSNLRLSFPYNGARADVLLTNGARVDVTNRGNGSIAVNARNIDISSGSSRSSIQSGIKQDLVSNDNEPGDIILNATEAVTIRDGSFILSAVGLGATGNTGDISVKARSLSLVNGAGLSSISRGQGNAGNISVDVRDRVALAGNNSSINNILFSEGNGLGGDITIDARSLSLTDGAFIQATTFGKGDAGNVYVRAEDFVSLANNTDLRTTQIRTVVEAGAVGNGGTIDIQTRSLSLANGAQLAASVFKGSPGGQGKGGDILINASDAVNITGFGINGFSSGVLTATEEGAKGPAGNITVNTTGRFRLTDGAIVSAQTFNGSEGGSITINATSFEVVNGGQVLTTASSSGNAGNITINSTENLTLSGSDPTNASRRAFFGDPVGNEGPASGLFASTRANSTGQGGDIAISTRNFRVRDGAEASVSSQGTGDAGDIKLTARSARLEDRGKLIAISASGKGGGNISLEELNLLLLRDGSEISTDARRGAGNGGDINIDTDLLAAVENSNITARAIEGRGGNIRLTTQGLFLSPDSNFTATSERGIDGVVEINRPDIDPSSGLVALSAELIDVSGLIAQGCSVGGGNVARESSEFIITGRGGVPPTPREALASEPALTDLGTPIQGQENRALAAPSTNPTSSPPPTQIVEAQGWVINNYGEVVLIASAPTATPHIPWLTQASCHAPETSS